MKKVLFCVAVLLAPSRASADLIVNGNFEQGYTGFTTGYHGARGPEVCPPSDVSQCSDGRRVIVENTQ